MDVTARGERAPCAVCTHPGAAQLLQPAGVAVVLMGLESGLLGRMAAGLRTVGGGRVAVFVGDPDDRDDLAAAVVMAEEQFGAAPVVVSSPTEAREVLLLMSGGGSSHT